MSGEESADLESVLSHCAESSSELIEINAFILLANSITTAVLLSLPPQALLFQSLGFFLFTTGVSSTLLGNIWALLLSFYVRLGVYRVKMLPVRERMMEATAGLETNEDRKAKLLLEINKFKEQAESEKKQAPDKMETEAAAALGVTFQVLYSVAINLFLVVVIPHGVGVSLLANTVRIDFRTITTGLSAMIFMNIIYIIWISVFGLFPGFRRSYYVGFEFVRARQLFSVAPTFVLLSLWPAVVLSTISVPITIGERVDRLLLLVWQSVSNAFLVQWSVLIWYLLIPPAFFVLLWGLIYGYREFVYTILIIPFREHRLRQALWAALKKHTRTWKFLIWLFAAIMLIGGFWLLLSYLVP